MDENYNGFSYSNESLSKSLNTIDEKECMKICGSIKTKLAVKEFKNTTEIIKANLKEGEVINKIIKARDITGIDALTIASFFKGAISYSYDYTVFKNLYFTTNKLILANTNVLGQHLSNFTIPINNIFCFVFTSQSLYINRNSKGEIKIRKQISSLVKFLSAWVIFYCALLSISFITSSSGDEFKYAFVTGLAFFIALLITIYREKSGDEMQLITKDGKVYKLSIANDDYKVARDYITENYKTLDKLKLKI